LVKPIRPIDAITLMEEIESKKELIDSEGHPEELQEVIDAIFDGVIKLINRRSTVQAFTDTVPIAYWIPLTPMRFCCSSCRKESIGEQTHYCPHCGARMEEKDFVLARLQ
jgi:hypothetical protein